MRLNIYLSALLMGFLVMGCSPKGERPLSVREQFAEIVDIAQYPGVPTSPINGGFRDQGTWMGFSLPTEDVELFGFTGPFSLLSYEWVAPYLLSLREPNGGKIEVTKSNYLPGIIRLEGITSNGGQVTQELIYADSETALLKVRTDRSMELELRGKLFNNHYSIDVADGVVHIAMINGEKYSLVGPFESIEVDSSGYRLSIMVEGESVIALTQHRDMERTQEDIESIIAQSDNYFSNNEIRWNNYLITVLREGMPEGFDRVAVKSIVTLISNWVAPEGDLHYSGVIPSHAIHFFIGLWAWDSWKDAVGMAEFAPELAMEQIMAIAEYQDSIGMIADCVYADGRLNNWRNTKPPLLAWAVDSIYQKAKDEDFLRKMYPIMVKYYNWWYDRRDIDGNQICEYGATDNTREAAAWESGMDNAIRFDDAEMLSTPIGQGVLNQESVDLNAYLILESEILKRVADELGEEFEPRGISREQFRAYFYNPVDSFFFDRKVGGGAWIDSVKGCEAYTPIWTGIASREEVKAMLATLENEALFSTYIPFPTAANNHHKVEIDGYWRGSIWLDQTYFAISGLRRYGYSEMADSYTEQLFANLEGATGTAPLFENYNPNSGEGLRARHFSWTAAHLLMLYSEYASR